MKINLKQVTSGIKSTVAQATGKLENIAGAAGQGAFSISAGSNGVSINANFNSLLEKTKVGNLINSPLADLFDNNKVKEPLQFPNDLTDEHYMIFTVKNRIRQSRTDAAQDLSIRNIVLPIPSNLQTTYGAQYENADLGALGAAAAGRISSDQLSAAGNDLGELINSKISSSVGAFKSGDTDAQVQAGAPLAAAAATAVAGKLGGGAGAALGGAFTGASLVQGTLVDEGLAINPHMAVLFKGVDMREHSFSYKFIARNQQESEAIQGIISAYKYHMHPEYAAGSLAFKYPDEFEISFADAIAGNLYKIGTCVLKSMTVNYNGEGIPLFFDQTGAPVSVEIQLAFQETKIITRGDLDSGLPQPVNSKPEGS
ncbi:baseplate tail-tube junction protein [Porticoccaceae bacterium]|nr:baseplate tail-tube junction protein [Porticoccaceae bacterium]